MTKNKKKHHLLYTGGANDDIVKNSFYTSTNEDIEKWYTNIQSNKRTRILKASKDGI